MSSSPPPIPMTAGALPMGGTGVDRSYSDFKTSRRSRARNLEMLSIAAGVILLSYALRVQGDRVAFWFLPQWPLPQLCGARAWLGISCPGCGLTRSFIYLAHGHWEAAYHCHRLGWLLAAMTMLQIPYRLLCLKMGPVLRPVETRWITRMLTFALIANWVLSVFRV